jgi:hypothetical protein
MDQGAAPKTPNGKWSKKFKNKICTTLLTAFAALHPLIPFCHTILHCYLAVLLVMLMNVITICMVEHDTSTDHSTAAEQKTKSLLSNADYNF